MTDASNLQKAALLAEQETLQQQLRDLQMENAKQGLRAWPEALIAIEDLQRRLHTIMQQLENRAVKDDPTQGRIVLLPEQEPLRQRLNNLQVEQAVPGRRDKVATLVEIQDMQRRLSEVTFHLRVLIPRLSSISDGKTL